ncbi:MAG: hypothetical protein ACKPEA_10130 [Planctomycetota bacterium]
MSETHATSPNARANLLPGLGTRADVLGAIFIIAVKSGRDLGLVV